MSYCTLYITLSVSLTFSSFVFGSFNCNSSFMYVLLVIFQCHKKTRVQEMVGGDTNCLLYIPLGKEKKQQQKKAEEPLAVAHLLLPSPSLLFSSFCQPLDSSRTGHSW